MKLIALILGLILERLATQLLHLRELRWFDPYFDAAIGRVERLPGWMLYPAILATLSLPVIPVLVASLYLASASISLQWPHVVMAVLWVRWVLPRVRVDQMMSICWRVFIPLAAATLGLTVLWVSGLRRPTAP